MPSSFMWLDESGSNFEDEAITSAPFFRISLISSDLKFNKSLGTVPRINIFIF